MTTRPPAVLGHHSPDAQPLRAFIYDRNSKDSRHLGTAVRDQGVENQRLCEAHGWRIVEVFEDAGKSASRYTTRPRPDYDEMLRRAADRECDVIVAWEGSRLTRNTETYLTLRNLCQKIGILLCYNGRLYNMERSDDRFATHLDALLAEREADAIRDRNKRTHRLILERGRPPGRLPYGFTREYDPNSGALVRQVIDPQQGEVIREIARRVLAAEPCASIARDLNRRGVQPPWTSERWTMESVKRVVVRASTAAKRVHDGHVVADAKWPAILDEAQWAQCVRILTDPGRLTHRDGSVKWLLSGVVYCGPCGPADRRLYSHRVNSGMSYVCRECGGVSVRTGLIDPYVTDLVLSYVEREQFAASLTPDDANETARLALEEARAYEAQLQEATALAGRLTTGPGGMLVPALSAARLAAVEADLLPKIEAARVRAQHAAVPQVLREVAGPSARAVWRRWAAQGDLARQRAVIREVVRVSINKGGKGARSIKPHRIGVDWLR